MTSKFCDKTQKNRVEDKKYTSKLKMIQKTCLSFKISKEISARYSLEYKEIDLKIKISLTQ